MHSVYPCDQNKRGRQISTRKSHGVYWLIALLIVVPACYTIFQPPLIVQFLESKTYDFRFLMR
ncbi:MAG: hypothetical protein R8K50_02010, partial [Mariprofundus sp.]